MTFERRPAMQRVSIVYWEEEGGWLGYIQEYPDYWTQGESLDDLREHLKDLYEDLVSGVIPGIRKVGELMVPRQVPARSWPAMTSRWISLVPS
jgi:predicted RNase H-like HicB family nuclease